MSVGIRLISPFMSSPEKGAETSVYLASSPDVAEVTGRYFDKKKETSSSPESNDDAEALRLWKVESRARGPPG